MRNSGRRKRIFAHRVRQCALASVRARSAVAGTTYRGISPTYRVRGRRPTGPALSRVRRRVVALHRSLSRPTARCRHSVSIDKRRSASCRRSRASSADDLSLARGPQVLPPLAPPDRTHALAFVFLPPENRNPTKPPAKLLEN